MISKEAKQKRTITRLKKKIKSLEVTVQNLTKEVADLTEEKDMAWFMLDEMKASDIRNIDLSDELNEMVERQLGNLRLMQMNKGEA
tara:strand:+ start:215 stop:472 length:258 start_codon:yes stop_codon:yes gene_type:complete